MAWKGIDGRGLALPALQEHIDALPATTWASGMALHNTAAPNLSQWSPGNARQRILNLEQFFKVERGWSSGPHAFVDDNLVWLFTRFTDKGTHSPSWNGTKIGIEMVGDFATDDPTTGRGLAVVKNTVALFAMLHTKYGWDPANIKLHKEDPATTHDCPGKKIVKAKFIAMVQEYMGHGGDHHDKPPAVSNVKRGSVNVAAGDTLNLRTGSSASSSLITALPNGAALDVLGEVMNGTTKWLHVSAGLGRVGWVAARYVKLN